MYSEQREGWVYLSLETETWVGSDWKFVAHDAVSAWCLEMSSRSQISNVKMVLHVK